MVLLVITTVARIMISMFMQCVCVCVCVCVRMQGVCTCLKYPVNSCKIELLQFIDVDYITIHQHQPIGYCLVIKKNNMVHYIKENKPTQKVYTNAI